MTQWQKLLGLYGVPLKKFNVRYVGENHLLFAFEVKSDVDKVLMGELWSFDRHLVHLLMI